MVQLFVCLVGWLLCCSCELFVGARPDAGSVANGSFSTLAGAATEVVGDSLMPAALGLFGGVGGSGAVQVVKRLFSARSSPVSRQAPSPQVPPL